jgi:hypothetical protein
MKSTTRSTWQAGRGCVCNARPLRPKQANSQSSCMPSKSDRSVPIGRSANGRCEEKPPSARSHRPSIQQHVRTAGVLLMDAPARTYYWATSRGPRKTHGPGLLC